MVLSVLLFISAARADQIPERPSRYVVDLAGVIHDQTEMKLNGILQELDQKSSAQVLVLAVQSLEGLPIDDVSLQVAEKWMLGQKGKDNGLLILLAVQDRKYRFEVGYGLEEILPDSLVGSIGRETMVPTFKQGKYSEGVARAVLAVVAEIADARKIKISGMPKSTWRGRGKSPLGIVSSILLGIIMVVLFIRYPRLFLLLLLVGFGGRRSGWSGGGGFSGGGFGSFGGGGGGGFGGGGASGGW